MAEDESIFDLSMKKKKKKKKTPFDLSTLEDGSTPADDIENGIEEQQEGKEEKDNNNEGEGNLELDDFSKMKTKKKKKKPFNMDEIDNVLQEADQSGSGVLGPVVVPIDDFASFTEEGDESIAMDDDMDFNLPKKKKKKKKILELDLDQENLVDDDDDADITIGTEGEIRGSTTSSSSWVGSDRDYMYEELLLRVFNIMREKNPDMIAGEKRRFVMRPPQVLRVGTKKSSFANFLEICKMLHRQPKHLQAFLLAELGTSGSVDANNQLIIKGRFQQKQIENVLRRYIKEYVTCHTCRSPDTILQKDTRLFFLQCETCGSRCSVASIKSGFQAVTSKRAAIRAKTA